MHFGGHPIFFWKMQKTRKCAEKCGLQPPPPCVELPLQLCPIPATVGCHRRLATAIPVQPSVVSDGDGSVQHWAPEVGDCAGNAASGGWGGQSTTPGLGIGRRPGYKRHVIIRPLGWVRKRAKDAKTHRERTTLECVVRLLSRGRHQLHHSRMHFHGIILEHLSKAISKRRINMPSIGD